MAQLVIGVLAIQGDFQAHLNILQGLGITSRELRNPLDLVGVTHLIVPGGESTTIRKVALQNGLWEPLREFGGPVMGTCMGSIMMAKNILPSDFDGWGMIDMVIKRNAYGRQINSFFAPGRLSILDKPYEMVFIRAPKIVKLGHNVEPIAWLGDEVTGVRSGNKIALTFHPELSAGPAANKLHEYFLGL